VTPLYSADIGEPAAKRSRTAGPRGYGEPLPGPSAPGAGTVLLYLFSLLSVASKIEYNMFKNKCNNLKSYTKRPKINKKAFTVSGSGPMSEEEINIKFFLRLT
jgi:hypothetical protein